MGAQVGSKAVNLKLSYRVSGINAKLVRAVLEYESQMRGRPVGQVCYELVMEAADTGSYPAEVKARLAEIEAEAKASAVARALRQSAGGDEGEGGSVGL